MSDNDNENIPKELIGQPIEDVRLSVTEQQIMLLIQSMARTMRSQSERISALEDFVRTDHERIKVILMSHKDAIESIGINLNDVIKSISH